MRSARPVRQFFELKTVPAADRFRLWPGGFHLVAMVRADGRMVWRDRVALVAVCRAKGIADDAIGNRSSYSTRVSAEAACVRGIFHRCLYYLPLSD
jgi:hypothetical protein